MTLRKRIAFTAVIVALPFLAVALVEGFASLAVFVATVRHERVAEAVHTERDTLLGWINLPNVNKPDLYGPGIGLHTNGQRFRHDGELAPRAPAGKRRVVCSGGSFTLGYGVADAQTWCAILAIADTSLETVNMGQGAYGMDQAYLWYMRDGLPLHADVHLMTFISPDLRRIDHRRLNGYPKPWLELTGDSIRVAGVPVPRAGMGPLLAQVQVAAMSTLRTYEVFRHFFGSGAKWSDPTSKDSITWDVANAALRQLARRDKANGTTLVVVALPMIDDYKGAPSDQWRGWAHQAADRGDFELLDLVEVFRRIPPDSVAALFIPEGGTAFRGAAGHYTPAGNAWVAQQLLRVLPSLSR